MEQITLRIPVRLKADLEREAESQGVTRSEHIRNTLATRHEHDISQRVAELEAQIDELKDDLEYFKQQNKILTDEYQRQKEQTQALEVYQDTYRGRLKRRLFNE